MLEAPRCRSPKLTAAPLLLLAGCGIRYWVCDDVDVAKRLPKQLSETQLYADLASDTLAPGVTPYQPAYELWSDGAQKRRWISLPENARVDTSDVYSWEFPAGTKLWKEFTRDGVRVETRILAKLGPSDADWVAASYLWKADQSDALLASEAVPNALGTPHDVPAAKQCAGCHGGRKSRVLGFSAVQLSNQPELAALLTTPTTYSLPGDPEQRAALGYLYANCAHCHNTTRPKQTGARCYDPRSLDLDITQQKPTRTDLVDRMGRRGLGGMPPLASELVDTKGLALVKSWIAHP